MKARFCTCKIPAPQLVEGIRLCVDCGGQVPDPRDRLLLIIARQQGEIIDRLRRLEEPEATADGSTPLLSPAELARRLGKPRGWVYEHADELGAIRLGDGPKPRLLFDLEQARRRLSARANANGSRAKQQPEPAPRRRRRSNSDVALLPIRGERTND